MQKLLPVDDPAVTFPLSTGTRPDQLLDARSLQSLGERLRGAYSLEMEPLPARLAELVERLARRERTDEEAAD